MKPANNISTYAWALDFVRAMSERPLWARLLFRLAAGKYAHREFTGLVDELHRGGGYWDELGYGIEGANYNQDSVPIDWMSKSRRYE